MPSNSQLIFDSYFALTSACPSYQQCWMCDETIFRILNAHYPSLKKTLTFNRKGLNRALSAKASPCTSQNLHGIYMATFSTACPYSGDFRKVSYYFRRPTNDNQPPDHPVSALDVFDKHATSNQLEIVGEEGTGNENDKSLEITHKQIENMQKIIKSHRAALDFDRGFITSALKLAKNLDLKEEIEIGPQQKKRGRKRRQK